MPEKLCEFCRERPATAYPVPCMEPVHLCMSCLRLFLRSRGVYSRPEIFAAIVDSLTREEADA